MIGNGANKGWNAAIVGVATVLLAVWAAPASAETLVFHNGCNTPVIVQVVAVFQGIFHRDRPRLLHPGEATQPGIHLPGDKLITIYDARTPNRVLFQGAWAGRSLDQRLHILQHPQLPRLQLQPR